MAGSVSDIPFKASDALDTSRFASVSVYIVDTNEYPTSVCTLQHEAMLIDHIPGEETMPFSESNNLFVKELATPILQGLYNALHIFARKLSCSINALHAHILKGSRIVLTEDPKFHLVRQEGSVFIKPIPICLLDHSFWEHCIVSSLYTTQTLHRCLRILQTALEQ
jgi:hypothetical protein